MTPIAVVYCCEMPPGLSRWRRFLCWMARKASGSPLLHVCLGFGGAVLDPGLQGHRYWPATAFTLAYPGLKLAIIVRLKRSIDLDTGYDPRPRGNLPVLVRWLTGGRYPCRDCVQTVARHLRSGGLDIPARVTTIPELIHAIRRYPHAEEPLG